MHLHWSLHPFHAMSNGDLYRVLTLRQRVFVVEQKCVYLDCDGRDEEALHLLGHNDVGELLAYARILGPGVSYEEASIGRVVTAPSVRRLGLGRVLMREAITRAQSMFEGPLRIGAQRYLEAFYRDLGFVVAGEPYEEDGIPHIEMLRELEHSTRNPPH